MNNINRVYAPIFLEESNPSPGELRARWSSANTERLRTAVRDGLSLPRFFPPIKIEYEGKTCEFEDLRGAALDRMLILDYDLAYCALDNSNFEHSRLKGTRLQYSTISQASFRSATLEDVQASPVCGKATDFSAARLVRCYFSHSNLDNTVTDGAFISDCDFIEASKPLSPKFSNSDAIFTRNHNEALVHAVVVAYQERARKPAATLLKLSPNYRTSHSKIGRVLPSSKSSNVSVEVFSPQKNKRSGKVINKHVVYKVVGTTSAFSVGDTVLIHQVDPKDRRVAKELRAHGDGLKSKLSMNSSSTPKWWILGRQDPGDDSFVAEA